VKDLTLPSPSGSFYDNQSVVTDLTESDKKIEEEFRRNSVVRANIHFQHQYPANRNGFNVLSFMFGIVPIIHQSIDHADHEYTKLQLVVKDVPLLVCCVSHVRGTLIGRHSKEEYLENMSLAYDLLRDKHVMSVITKVLLLPIVLCWFPSMRTEPCIVTSTAHGPRGVVKDLKVRVVLCQTGLQNDFMDLEKVVLSDCESINYFV
jgi:hypothetical protein